jgi:hypothetical protein
MSVKSSIRDRRTFPGQNPVRVPLAKRGPCAVVRRVFVTFLESLGLARESRGVPNKTSNQREKMSKNRYADQAE